MLELFEELGELDGTFAMEDAEDPGDHLELDGFQFTFSDCSDGWSRSDTVGVRTPSSGRSPS